MRTSTYERKRPLAWRIVFTLFLIVLGLYTLLSHSHIVAQSVTVVENAQIAWLTLALIGMSSTFCIAAATYVVLAVHPLRYRQTLVVEIASACVNRLLPAGLGGLGLNGVYLYHKRHTAAEATAVVSVNNLVGMCGHILLLVAVCFVRPNTVRALFSRHVSIPDLGWLLWLFLAGLVLLGLIPVIRIRFVSFMHNLLRSVGRLSRVSIAEALLLSGLLTFAYTFVLYAVCRCVGVELDVVSVFIVFSVGVFVGTAVPTPGGLVGTDAALFTALIAYGTSDASAGAAVLAYRAISYWLPLLPGAIAFLQIRGRSQS